MSAGRRLVLVCNSHIDPVWLWPWEEGLAATLATFRAAAGFCEEFDGFVFCHNEALLYQWVEEYEPALFDRIRRLVADRPLARDRRLVRAARLQSSVGRVVRAPDHDRPALLPGEVRRPAARRLQRRSVRPQPRASCRC